MRFLLLLIGFLFLAAPALAEEKLCAKGNAQARIKCLTDLINGGFKLEMTGHTIQGAPACLGTQTEGTDVPVLKKCGEVQTTLTWNVKKLDKKK